MAPPDFGVVGRTNGGVDRHSNHGSRAALGTVGLRRSSPLHPLHAAPLVELTRALLLCETAAMGSAGEKPRKTRRRLAKVPRGLEPNNPPLAGLTNTSGGVYGSRVDHEAATHHSRDLGRVGRTFLRLLGRRPYHVDTTKRARVGGSRSCPFSRLEGLDLGARAPVPRVRFRSDELPVGYFVPTLQRCANEWKLVLARDDASVRTREDRWSALEYGCHVRDVCCVMDGRLALMLVENNPVFPNWDQDETALAEHYDQQDPTFVGRRNRRDRRPIRSARGVNRPDYVVVPRHPFERKSLQRRNAGALRPARSAPPSLGRQQRPVVTRRPICPAPLRARRVPSARARVQRRGTA